MCDYAEAAKAAHAFASGQIRELTHHSKTLKAIGPRILRGGAEALKTKCPDAFDA